MQTWSPAQNSKAGGANMKALSSYIMQKIKQNQEGHAKKFKARVVARGNRRVFEGNYDSVYAPVVSFGNFLLTVIVSFKLGWFMWHVDVTAAFLNCDIDREFYIRFTYNLPKCRFLKLIFSLHKALYDLKQAPLLWNKSFARF